MKEFTVTVPYDPAIRFDKTVAEAIKDQRISRVQVQKAIKAGLVKTVTGDVVLDWPSIASLPRVGGDPMDPHLHGGVTLMITLDPPHTEKVGGEKIDLNIIHEDDYVLVINKPAGLVVHPGAGNWTGTLVNGLVSYLGDDVMDVGDESRPGLVHRLDKDTSGLMVVAKTEEARAYLSDQLADRSMSRVYSALCWGTPPLPAMTFDAPIGRHLRDRLKMCVSGKGRDAVTHIKRKALLAGGLLTLVDCHLETGRTHQIRVHMSHYGFPIVGDPTYGLQMTSGRARGKEHGASPEQIEALLGFPRQALHAHKLTFIHPETEEEVHFEAPLPYDYDALLKLFL